MTLIKIALTGKMRAGKDTVFKIIEQELVDYAESNLLVPEVHQIAFGDSLKEYARALFPEKFGDGKKPRQLFQDFGQTMRQFNPDVWVNKVGQKVQQASRHEDYIISYYSPSDSPNNTSNEAPRGFLVAPIITDLRQPNEYNYCKENGFYIVKVTAPDEVRLARMQSTGDNFNEDSLKHETESYIDRYDVDFVINNDGSRMEELREKVKQMIQEIYTIEGINQRGVTS